MGTVMIGIDPGYDRVGWAVGNVKGQQVTVLEYGCIQTNKKSSILERYLQIDSELTVILQKHQPQEAAIESVFFSKNQTTAMRVSEARGLIISTLIRHRCNFYEYNPMQVKLAVTGYGKADKTAVDKMVRMQLHLPSEKIIDDTMDALAMLLTHATSVSLTKRV